MVSAVVLNIIEDFVIMKHFIIFAAQECLEYKLRVQEALKNKKKNVPRKKERGKDRLLRIAGKASQHIRFDEGMDENVGVVPQTQLCDKDSQASNEAEEPESTTD